MRELLRATDRAGKETKKLVRDELRKSARPVLDDARRRLAPIDGRSAARLGISVRKVGTVAVEQRLRRTSGLRPDFGRLQMGRVLIPALEDNTDAVVASLDATLERLTDEWGRGG